VKALLLTLTLCLALAAAGCGGGGATLDTEEASAPAAEGAGAEATTDKKKPKVTVPKGAPPKKLVIEDIEKGTGPEAKAGDEVSVEYVGVSFKDGKEFDSSWSRNEPFPFQLGAGMVIPGWDKGIEGMKVGGRRELVIPPNLAYGPAGQPPAIGPNETLVFVVDLLAIN
jgi:peptidylprolyl isomerase